METPEQSGLVMDCKIGDVVADSPVQEKDDELVCVEADASDSQREVDNSSSSSSSFFMPASTSETDKLDCSESSVCSVTPCQDQKTVIRSDQGREELNRNESINSSVSDTLSSADSVYEVEAHRKRQDTAEQDPEQAPELSAEPGKGSKQDPEPVEDCNVEPLQEPEQEPEPEPKEDFEMGYYPEHVEDPEPELETKEELVMGFYPEPEQEPDLEPKEDFEVTFYPECVPDPEEEQEPELEPKDECEMGYYPECEPDPELIQYCKPEHEGGLELYSDPEAGNITISTEDEPDQSPAIDPDREPEAHDHLPEQPFKEESTLEQCIREEAMSDVSNESYLNPEEMDECLRIEVGATSSDSETDEKWRAIFSSSINREDDDSYLDSLQLSAQELFVQKVETTDLNERDSSNFDEVCFEIPKFSEVLEQPEEIVSSPVPPQEVKYCPLGLQGLSKISEDEGENGRDSNYNYTKHQDLSLDTAKKLPKDFCVIQETKSENVSTEHVNFQLARKQWREMEQQMKNKILLPTTKKSSFHGSHSFMYTPVRNIERSQKKAQDLETLNLCDYSHTQFSPCSEDSGLGDSSYRSPYDDSETPIEREIRISIEREDIFKKERALSRMGKSTDCAPSRSIPRSISTPLTPSFIITSSPTKEPLKREVSANNVIILDPRNDFSSNPKHGNIALSAPGQSGEWRPEDGSSNLIILETSNLIIRSASEFSLNKTCDQPQEKMFLNNPFFKLRSRSTISLVDEEIRMVKQREEELRKERANLYGKEQLSSSPMDTLAFDHSVVVPMKCKSSPSSPMKSAHRMDRSALSCDHRDADPETQQAGGGTFWKTGAFT